MSNANASVQKIYPGNVFFSRSLLRIVDDHGRLTYEYYNSLLPTNCLSVFDNFEGLALKGLTLIFLTFFKPLASFHTPWK